MKTTQEMNFNLFLNKSSKTLHHSRIVFILFWLYFSIFRLPIIVNRYTCLNEIFNNSPLSLFVSPHPSYFRKTAHFCSKLLMAKCMNRERCCRSSIWGVPNSTQSTKRKFSLCKKVICGTFLNSINCQNVSISFLKTYLKSILQKSQNKLSFFSVLISSSTLQLK